jgi:hypothetical protein
MSPAAVTRGYGVYAGNTGGYTERAIEQRQWTPAR